jgi:thiol-disulfide isomerase/thioredoxin
MKYSLLLLALPFILMQCKSVNEKKVETSSNVKGYQIKVSVKAPNPDGFIYLSKIKDQRPQVLDSTRIDGNGIATFTGNLKTPGYYLLNVYGQREALIILDNDSMEVYMDNTSENGDLRITGSKLMDQYNQIQAYNKEYEAVLNTTRVQYESLQRNNAQPEELKALETRNNNYLIETQSKIKAFLRAQKPATIVTLYAATALDVNKDFNFLDSAIRDLKQTYPDNDDIISFAEYIGKFGSLRPGAEAPAIEQNTPEGGKLSLASLKGKYVLIDFWASWCGPCRRANPDLVATYAKFKGKKFEILGVSLDKDAAEWKAAIKADKLTWPQVSDLMYWNNAAARTYQVESIPSSFLVGPDGKIIARDLSHTELEEYLTKTLK